MSPARKNKFHGGRWQQQRERCRITDTRPPAPKCESKGVGEALNKILGKLGVESLPTATRLEREWKTLVGETVAGHTHPSQLQADGALTVLVDSSVWYSELSRIKGQILQSVQQHLGTEKVRTLVLRLDPEVGRASSGGYRPRKRPR